MAKIWDALLSDRFGHRKGSFGQEQTFKLGGLSDRVWSTAAIFPKGREVGFCGRSLTTCQTAGFFGIRDSLYT